VSTAAAPDPPHQSRTPVGARVFRLVVGVVITAAALKLAQPVLVPLVAGIFLAVVARPIQRGVAAVLPRRLRWLGLVTAMVTVLAGVVAFGGSLYLSARAVASELRERRPRITAALADTRARLDRIGVPASVLPEPPAAGRASPEPPAGSPTTESGAGAPAGGATGAVRRVAATAVEAFGGLILALAFCALGLAEAGAARRRLVQAIPDRVTPAVLGAVDEAVAAFRRYAWVKTLTSLLTGAVTTGAALALGLPLAWVWGFLTFLLEYVPSIGSVLAIIPPTLMAFADGGAARGTATFFIIGTLQILMGNVVDPKLEGRFLSVSPFVVLLAIVVWGWLWGPVGALLAVPMTVATVIACRHTPGARGIATLLAEERTEGGEQGADGERSG
jgi:predicted PurR-regulated permease PerM